MSTINEKDLASFKELLEKEAGELEAQLKGIKKNKDFGSDVDAFDGETDEAEEDANTVDLIETNKHRLEDIEAALEKIAQGTYGACEKCQKTIEIPVLQASPESQLCKACKASL